MDNFGYVRVVGLLSLNNNKNNLTFLSSQTEAKMQEVLGHLKRGIIFVVKMYLYVFVVYGLVSVLLTLLVHNYGV